MRCLKKTVRTQFHDACHRIHHVFQRRPRTCIFAHARVELGEHLVGHSSFGRCECNQPDHCQNLFASGVPIELEEAAEIDGCGTVQTFLRVVLPLSKAMLSVILLYYAVARWNNYTSALYYLPMAPEKYPLQMVLRQLLVTMQETAIAESSNWQPTMQIWPTRSNTR